MDEKILIEKCKKKEKRAQKYLFDKYSQILLGICIRYSNNISEAEDVLQEGFIKIFTNIERYEGKGSFEGWLKKIVVNTAITYYYKNLKHKYHQDVTDIQETSIVNNKYATAEFTKEELLNVIHSLSDGYRTVFNLYAIEGYKHKEIAEILDIDISTSKSQYFRARLRIQKELKKLKQINYAKK